MRHKLLNKSNETLIGDCAVCGPGVALTRRKSGVLQCKTARKAQRYGSKLSHSHILALSGIDRCAICGTDERLIVDHDHSCCPMTKGSSCGKCIRGILCHNCNVALGMFGDDRDRIGNAYLYMTIWREQAPT